MGSYVLILGLESFVVSNETSNSPSMRRSEEHTSELQSHVNLVCRLLLEKKKNSYEKQAKQTRYCPCISVPLQYTSHLPRNARISRTFISLRDSLIAND